MIYNVPLEHVIGCVYSLLEREAAITVSERDKTIFQNDETVRDLSRPTSTGRQKSPEKKTKQRVQPNNGEKDEGETRVPDTFTVPKENPIVACYEAGKN